MEKKELYFFAALELDLTLTTTKLNVTYDPTKFEVKEKSKPTELVSSECAEF